MSGRGEAAMGGGQERATARDEATLVRLLRLVTLTADEEIDCTTCLDLVPAYVEQEFSGADVAVAMDPLSRHLALCRDCYEEYELLRDLVGLENIGGLPDSDYARWP